MALEDYLVPIDHDTDQRILGCNPCDRCGRNIRDCPWLHSGKEVEGWIAEPSTIPSPPKSIRTFHILYCPLYLPPKPRKTIIPTTEGPA